MNPASAWARAFAVTLAIELIVVLAITRDSKESVPRRALLVTFANFVTHPIVWFVIPEWISNRAPQLVVCETWAILAEAIFYALTMRMRGARAFGIAAVANAASYGVGIVLRALTHAI